jgi:hypothetical protein
MSSVLKSKWTDDGSKPAAFTALGRIFIGSAPTWSSVRIEEHGFALFPDLAAVLL